jgi:hypothetical protein
MGGPPCVKRRIHDFPGCGSISPGLYWPADGTGDRRHHPHRQYKHPAAAAGRLFSSHGAGHRHPQCSGERYRFFHDSAGKPEKTMYPDGSCSITNYDLNGRLLCTRDRRDQQLPELQPGRPGDPANRLRQPHPDHRHPAHPPRAGPGHPQRVRGKPAGDGGEGHQRRRLVPGADPQPAESPGRFGHGCVQPGGRAGGGQREADPGGQLPGPSRQDPLRDLHSPGGGLRL